MKEPSMIPPPPPALPLLKIKPSQSHAPPRPQQAAIPFTSDSKPPVQETGHELDQNSQAEEASSSLPSEEYGLQSSPPVSQSDNPPPDAERETLPMQETSPAAEALTSQQNETAVEKDRTQEHEDIYLP